MKGILPKRSSSLFLMDTRPSSNQVRYSLWNKEMVLISTGQKIFLFVFFFTPQLQCKGSNNNKTIKQNKRTNTDQLECWFWGRQDSSLSQVMNMGRKVLAAMKVVFAEMWSLTCKQIAYLFFFVHSSSKTWNSFYWRT
jgi:hypothetical protein